MLTITLTALFTVVALGSIVSLADSALKLRNAYRAMKAELALDCISAVPVSEGAVVTLHTPAARNSAISQQPAPAPFAIAA